MSHYPENGLETGTVAALVRRRTPRLLSIAAVIALAMGASITTASAAHAEDDPVATTGTVSGTVTITTALAQAHYEQRLLVRLIPIGTAAPSIDIYSSDLGGYSVVDVPAGSYSSYASIEVNYPDYGWYGFMTYQPGDRYDDVADTVTVTASATTVADFDMRNPIGVRGNPQIRGVMSVGSTLTALPGKWSSDTLFSYQWTANGTPIAGATASTLTLGASQYKKLIGLELTGYKTDFVPFTTSTEQNFPVTIGSLTTTPKPTISGTAKVGKKLTAKAGTWKPAPVTLAYQWKANGKAITGATKSTFTVTKAVKGKKLTVSVKGAKSAFTTVTTTSSSTAAVT